MVYQFYNGPVSIQSVGWIILDSLTGDMLISVVNDGPEATGTTLATLASYLSTGPMSVDLTATGNSRATALLLPSQGCIFTTVAAGTGAVIPDDATIGSRWDVWNAGANDMYVWPMTGAQINGFGIGNPATVVAGSRTTFALNSATQVYAR